MFFRRSIQWFVAACAILLVAGASLPQLVCCCNASWGPGGLLGSRALCGERSANAAPASAPKAACPHCSSNREAGEESSSPKYSREECQCRFALVQPPPMNGPVVVQVEHVAANVSWLDGHAQLAPAIDSTGNSLLELPGICLTPGARCALLQNWRA